MFWMNSVSISGRQRHTDTRMTQTSPPGRYRITR